MRSLRQKLSILLVMAIVLHYMTLLHVVYFNDTNRRIYLVHNDHEMFGTFYSSENSTNANLKEGVAFIVTSKAPMSFPSEWIIPETHQICNRPLLNSTQDSYPYNNDTSFPQKRHIVCEPSVPKFDKECMIFLVLSTQTRKDHRDLIRGTWAKFLYEKYGTDHTMFVLVIFIIGTSNRNSENNMFWNEASDYQDILWVDVAEDYNHLTYKEQAAFAWILNNTGPEVTHIFKTDDDVLVNVFAWIHIAQNPLLKSPNNQYIVGANCHRNTVVNIDPKKGVRKISKDEYSQRRYPPFCSGAGYLMPRATLHAFVRNIHNFRGFRKEDVHFTGLMATKLNITRLVAPYYKHIKLQKSSKLAFKNTIYPLVIHFVDWQEALWKSTWRKYIALANGDSKHWPIYRVDHFDGTFIF